jgi:hypothetical protein
MIRVNLSDSALLAQVIPGAILLLTIGASFWPSIEHLLEPIKGMLVSIRDDMNLDSAVVFAAGAAIVLLLGYVTSLFLGAVVAVLMGYVEYGLLDRFAAKDLKLTSQEYFDEWNRYVDHLDDKTNPYVSRVVESFMFEFRTGMALLICGLVLLIFTPVSYGWSVVTILASILLLRAGIDDHCNLAEFRHRRFSSSNLFGLDAEDAVRKLIARWCDRQELLPLAKVSSIWPFPEKGNEHLAATINCLEEITDMAPSVVFPAEIDLLRRALASLRQRQLGANG